MVLFPTRFLKISELRLLCLMLLAVLLLPATVFAACGTAPTVRFDQIVKYAGAGKSVDFSVTITNNDAASCDFDLVASGDTAGFTSLLVDGTPFTLAGGAKGTTTLRVSIGSVSDWTSNVTNYAVDAVNLSATTTVFDNSPLMHNSINTESTKHGGNWGTSKPGSVYGNITCSTCHVKNSANIKRIRTSITTPDNTFGSFPGDGQPIVFQTPTDGSSDFGDDTGGHAVSNRICEVCHTFDATKANGVDQHAYTMAGDAGHFNRRDCTACHKHNQGFKAGACYSCHGGGTQGAVGTNFWPDASTTHDGNKIPGRHLAHMNALSQQLYGVTAIALLDDPAANAKQVDICGYCHDTPGGDADHSETLPAETAFHPLWNKAAAASGSYLAGNCSNIACHNNKATGTGTFGWTDSGTSTCSMCHNDITTNATTTGNTHNDHLNAAATFGRSITCATCHDAATSWSGNVKPASGHLNGLLNITGNVALTYTGTIPPGTSFGTCGTNACHNDGKGGVPFNNSYVWSDTNLANCSICHAAVPATGSHAAHVSTAETSYAGGADWAGNKSTPTSYDFGCGNCHGSVLSNHLNGSVNLVNVGYNAPAAGQCNSTLCHFDGVATSKASPAWGGSFSGDKCAGCHLNSPASNAHAAHEVGFHYNAVYSGLIGFLPVKNSDSYDAGLDNSIFDQLRGHGGNIGGVTGEATTTSTIITCRVCHWDTVKDRFNDLNTTCAGCHDGTNAPLEGNMTIADKSKHVNGAIDVVFFPKKVRSKAQLRDDLTEVPEISNNWTRINGYKLKDGSSYDEQTDTLNNLGTWDSGSTTCMVSCHLWEANRVDKTPVNWTGGAIMCIDCHTRLPK